MTTRVREQGVYERRDGAIVSVDQHAAGAIVCGGFQYVHDGRCTADDNYDLIREIVVGPGWIPHNGGENPAPGKRVEIINRGGTLYAADRSECFAWDHGEPWPMGHILAYRILDEAAEPAKEDAAKPAIEPQFFREKVPTKLRPDLPARINIDKADNGGFIIARGDFLEFGRPKIIAALTSGEDLLAWLTEQPA